jgi:hypothetical protein
MSKRPSPESHKEQYTQERLQREQLAFLRGPITRMEVQDALQRVQLALATIQLSTELLAQFFADKGQLNIEEFRTYCITKMQSAAAAESGPAEPAGQEPVSNGIVLTDGGDNATDTQGIKDSGEHAERVRE